MSTGLPWRCCKRNGWVGHAVYTSAATSLSDEKRETIQMPKKKTAAPPKKERVARARRKTTVKKTDSVQQQEEVGPDGIFATIRTRLITNGIVILYRGKIPANPWNLFEQVVSKGEHISVKIDDAFVRALRKREEAKR